MPRKPDDTCLFCDPDPCSCGPKKPAKKAAVRAAKKTAPKTITSSGPVTPSVPTVDIKAAMLAAQSPLDPPRLEPKKSTRTDSSGAKTGRSSTAEEQRFIRQEVSDSLQDEREMTAAMVMIEPLLHPDERAKYDKELNTTMAKGARWRREV